eukprot:gene2668-3341_t
MPKCAPVPNARDKRLAALTAGITTLAAFDGPQLARDLHSMQLRDHGRVDCLLDGLQEAAAAAWEGALWGLPTIPCATCSGDDEATRQADPSKTQHAYLCLLWLDGCQPVSWLAAKRKHLCANLLGPASKAHYRLTRAAALCVLLLRDHNDSSDGTAPIPFPTAQLVATVFSKASDLLTRPPGPLVSLPPAVQASQDELHSLVELLPCTITSLISACVTCCKTAPLAAVPLPLSWSVCFLLGKITDSCGEYASQPAGPDLVQCHRSHLPSRAAKALGKVLEASEFSLSEYSDTDGDTQPCATLLAASPQSLSSASIGPLLVHSLLLSLPTVQQGQSCIYGTPGFDMDPLSILRAFSDLATSSDLLGNLIADDCMLIRHLHRALRLHVACLPPKQVHLDVSGVGWARALACMSSWCGCLRPLAEFISSVGGDAVAYDPEPVAELFLDYLVSSETEFLEYLSALLRHVNLSPTCITHYREAAALCVAVFNPLRLRLQSMSRRGLLPYNPAPLLRRLGAFLGTCGSDAIPLPDSISES